MQIRIVICFLVKFTCVLCSLSTKQRNKRCLTTNLSSPEFINNIFNKYGTSGSNNSIVLSSARFEDLIESLGIGRVRKCNDSSCVDQDHKDESIKTTRVPTTKGGLKKSKRTVNKRRERAPPTKRSRDNTKVCLKSGKILSLNRIRENAIITKEEFFRVCPTLIQQIDNKICTQQDEDDDDHGDEDDDHDDDDDDHDDHDHDDDDDDDDHSDHDHAEGDHDGHSHGAPKASLVWGYGFASITIISVLCFSVIGIIPCLQKSFYATIMSFLVALAVGTLTGDALLHLLPHAFLEGSNSAAKVKIDDEAEINQHYALVHRALFALLGMYAFFIVEQIMTITKGSAHGHSHGHDVDYNRSDSKKGLIKKDSTSIYNGNTNTDSEEREECVTEMGTAENGKVPHAVVNRYEDSRKHVQGEGATMSITSVAWMVMVGDGFHNFSDGLAVGAAFSSSVASGLSTSIAIFCHELPHELGDFAILIRNGMSVKQALVYNVTSAFLAYLGLIVGILAGEYEFGRHLILSITAGLFLYVSLVDMLPELMQTPKQSRAASFICQHLGLLAGVGIMLVISLYEHSM